MTVSLRSILIALVVAWPCIAHAQIPTGHPDVSFRPTRGLTIVGAGLTGDADATALELNPAELAWDRGGGFALAGQLAAREAPIAGRGMGGFLSLPLGGLTLGLGFQQLAAAGPFRSLVDPVPTSYGARSKLSLGFGARLGNRLAIGATWSHLYGDAYGGLDTLDVGLSLRLVRFAALGFVIEDAFRPRLPGVAARLPRRYAGELLIRPLGSSALEVAAGAVVDDHDDEHQLGGRFRARVRLFRGLTAFGELGLFQRPPGEPGRDHDRRVGAGLAFDLDHLGLAVGGTQVSYPSGSLPSGTDSTGLGFVLRATGDRPPAPLFRSRSVADVELAGLDDDDDFVRKSLLLARLEAEPGTVGVLLRVRDLGLSLGRIEELRERIAALRASGKRVLVHLRGADTKSLYLAAAADHVSLHPAGSVSFTGIASTTPFFAGTLATLGVRAEVVRVAEYKGAYEPYSETGFTEAVRQNRRAILDDVIARVLATIAAERSRIGKATRAAELLERGLFPPGEAVRLGLADSVADDDEVERTAAKLSGDEDTAVRAPDTSPRRSPRFFARRVAIVMIDGAITQGSSRRLPFDDEGLVGDDTIIDALDACRRDGNVGAVVLRVNSPGGSAVASDRIARAVRRLRDAGKPVVVSFGDVAASGGYYVAAPAHAIFAEPSTLTGSIGVIAMKVNAEELLDRVGITVETERRGSHADMNGAHRPWTEEERQLMDARLRDTYGLFLDTVVEGRKRRGLDRQKVDAVGRGKVFTGAQATRAALIDRRGDLVAAVRAAAEAGRVPTGPQGLPDVSITPRGGFFANLRAMGGASAALADAVAPVSEVAPAPLRSLWHAVASTFGASDGGVTLRPPFDLDL